MTISLDYIVENNLPIKTYLDFTNSSYSSISGSTFTQLNIAGQTNYDFISEGLLNHPQRGVEGITFDNTQKLSSRLSNIISDASSYSILIVSKNSNNSLLKVGKNNPNLPKLLKIDYTQTNFLQEYSRLNLNDQVLSLGDLEDTQICLLSHDIISGLTNTSINLSDFQKNTKLDAGYLLSNLSSFILGENFEGELLQFLLFVPAIENMHLLELGRRISQYIPQSELKFDKLFLVTEKELKKVSSLINLPKIKFNLPIKIKIPEYNGTLRFSSNLTLLASYLWDNLSEDNWDNISETLWDNIG